MGKVEIRACHRRPGGLAPTRARGGPPPPQGGGWPLASRGVDGGHQSVLFSPSLAAAAADLESRFIEGALGNLHAADWRNFGHGRHHWMAKRPSETGIVA